MVTHYGTLCKDADLLADLLTTVRCMLMLPGVAQDYCAQSGFDRQVLQLVEFCVRVMLRGYDGDPGGPMEEAYGIILEGIKKMLLLGIGVLHNLVLMNENRHLQLWLDLFCTNQEGPWGDLPHYEDPDQDEDEDESPPLEDCERLALVATFAADEHARKAAGFAAGPDEPAPLSSNARLGRGEEATLDAEQKSSPTDIAVNRKAAGTATEARRVGSSEDRTQQPFLSHDPAKSYKLREHVGSNVRGGLGQYDRSKAPKNITFSESLNKLFNPEQHAALCRIRPMKVEDTPKFYLSAKRALVASIHSQFPELDGLGDGCKNGEEPEDIEDGVDFEDTIRSEFVRLFPGTLDDARAETSELEYDDEIDLDVEDYSGDMPKPRGILADLPLVVVPPELDDLALIIATGINVVPHAARMDENKRLMQNMRCHIMLNQTAGRQLLKELFVFLAAWEVAEDKRYFHAMTNITLALLMHGLIPFAYHALADPKDIVSPAQNTLLKILHYDLCAKMRKGAPIWTPGPADTPATLPAHQVPDLHTIQHLLAVFRQDVLPPTLAVIWLQGQALAGRCAPEEFPLNLWDMERVYEGVYQFLDVFAALNDVPMWKALPVQFELAHDVLQLLSYLDEHIPKGDIEPPPLLPGGEPTAEPDIDFPAPPAPASTQQSTGPAPIDPSPPASALEERPYDPLPLVPPQPASEQRPAWPQPPVAPPGPSAPSPATMSLPHPLSDAAAKDSSVATAAAAAEAATPAHMFPWANLKKACLMTLSQLLHGTPAMRRQVRRLEGGGVPTILRCCAAPDKHNDGLKEHAVLCLKLLWDGEPRDAAASTERG